MALEQDLSTARTEENSRFKVRTLEPLEAGSGIYLPPGAEVHGHISRVDAPAHVPLLAGVPPGQRRRVAGPQGWVPVGRGPPEPARPPSAV